MKNQKIGVIVQARMTSTRLPGKVLKELDKSETVLDVLIKRLKLSKLTDIIIIATTPDKKNQLIIENAESHNVSWFVGDEENVLERYYLAAKEYKLDTIIRITSDCPFNDPKILDEMINFFSNNDYDYIKNVDENLDYIRGFEIEIFTFEVLERVFKLAELKSEKEHVTYYIYTHPEQFKILKYEYEILNKYNDLRLTIDEIEDLRICREVYKRLKEENKGIDFTISDIIDIIEKNPELKDINKNILQKKA
jgi:spore coat polysaccharide biosynthesis protein SpsF